jgi:hypothetical protein
MHTEHWWESQKERDHWEDEDNIKMDLREIEWMDWIGLM